MIEEYKYSICVESNQTINCANSFLKHTIKKIRRGHALGTKFVSPVPFNSLNTPYKWEIILIHTQKLKYNNNIVINTSTV